MIFPRVEFEALSFQVHVTSDRRSVRDWGAEENTYQVPNTSGDSMKILTDGYW